MRFLDEHDESCPAVSIGDYFRECIRSENIPTSSNEVDIHAVYATPKNDYCHVLLNWGVKNVFLVIVTLPQELSVFGHYLLDLNEEYGLYETQEDS